ncbi:MAG: hypothetical protein ACKV2T_39335 [Kofleriaceae bacterium]
MRLLLAVLLVGPAAANPKPDSKSDPKPPTKSDKKPTIASRVKGMSEAQRGVEITPSRDYWSDVTRAPSFGGGTSLGMVQTPAWHNDMRDYSEGGMVIQPPDTGDDMNIVPGTDWLTDRPPFRRFYNVLKYGIDRGLEALIPSAGGT